MIPYLACMLTVATTFGLPPRVLPAIQMVEGGASGLVQRNSNGTEDLGVMQVNTIWIPVFASQVGLSEEAMRDRLLNRPCFNIAIAGAIMSMHLRETHGDLAKAIGNYHSRSPGLHGRYQAKVGAAAEKLFGKADEPRPTAWQTEAVMEPPPINAGIEQTRLSMPSSDVSRVGLTVKPRSK